MNNYSGNNAEQSTSAVIIGIVSAVLVVFISVQMIIKTKFSSLLPEFILYVVYLMILAAFSRHRGLLRSGIVTLAISTFVVIAWALAKFLLPMILYG